MSQPSRVDYSRYGGIAATWEDVHAFGQASWEPGVHVVGLGGGRHLDLLIGGEPAEIPDGRALPVFFSGAGGASTVPQFWGQRIAGSLGSGFVAVADPTLTGRDLTVGWYGGTAGSGTQQRITEILDILGARLQRELLLAGGGAAGFAALVFASRARVPVSAFAWNPHTQVLAYSAAPVARYLCAALGLTEREVSRLTVAERSALLARGGIQHVVRGTDVVANPHLNRMLLLQTTAGRQVREHTAPFLASSPFQRVDHQRWADPRGRSVWFGDAGGRAGSAPGTVVQTVIAELVDVSCDVAAPLKGLQEAGLLAADGVGNLPRDLRAEDAPVEVVAWRHEDGTVTPRAVSLTDDLEQGGLRAVTVSEGPPLQVDIQDGFGHVIASRQPPVLPVDPRGVFIVGSCVARDTFEYLDPAAFRLLDYVARQSLISTFSTAGPAPIDPGLLSSRFQRRMAELDAASSLLDMLTDRAGSIDVLLWDLTDERLGVLRHPDGRFTTDSVDIRAVISPTARARVDLVPMGSAEHSQLFRSAAIHWRSFLERTGLFDRVVLLAPPWAGASLPPGRHLTSFGIDAPAGNRMYEPYYAWVQELVGVPVLGHDLEDATSPIAHRWGPAPFHYDEHTYVRLARQIATHAVTQPRRAWDAQVDPAVLVRRAPAYDPAAAQPAVPDQAEPSARAVLANGQIRVVVSGVEGSRVCVHVYRDGERIAVTPWSAARSASVAAPGSGMFRARVHVQQPDGGRLVLTTNAVRA